MVIQALDPDWIWIGTQPEMLVPDPYQMNTDRKPFSGFTSRHTEPNSCGAEAGGRAEEGSAPFGTGSAWLPRRRRGQASPSPTSVADPDPLVRGTDPAPDPSLFS